MTKNRNKKTSNRRTVWGDVDVDVDVDAKIVIGKSQNGFSFARCVLVVFTPPVHCQCRGRI